MPYKDAQRIVFNVPAGAGSYAPERLTFGGVGATPALGLLGVTALVESLPATAAVELWLPRLGVVAPTDADYYPAGLGLTAVGAQTWPLASYPGAQIRVKSGGTAGTSTVSAVAD